MKNKKKILGLFCAIAPITLLSLPISQNIKNNNVSDKQINEISEKNTIKKKIPAKVIGAEEGTITIEYTTPSNCTISDSSGFVVRGDYNFNGGHFTYEGENFTITEIGKSVFERSTFGNPHFRKCNLTIPGTIKKIGNRAFAENHKEDMWNDIGITSICFEEGIECIEEEAFDKLDDIHINYLVLPNSIRTIGSKAFNRCVFFNWDLSKLDHVIAAGKDVIGNSPNITKLIFKNEHMKNQYMNNKDWGVYTKYETKWLIKGIDMISVSLPGDVFGKYKGIFFANCIDYNNCKIVKIDSDFKITDSFNFNNGKFSHNGVDFIITSIGANSFKEWPKKETLKLPNTIKNFDDQAFSKSKFNTLDLSAIDHEIEINHNPFDKLGCLANSKVNKIIIRSERVKQKFLANKYWATCANLFQVQDIPVIEDIVEVSAKLLGAKQGTVWIDDSISPDECKIIKVKNFLATDCFNFNLGNVKVGSETLTITEIGDEAFRHEENDEQMFKNCVLSVAPTIRKIGNYAFAESLDCKNKNEITKFIFLNGLEEISEGAFENVEVSNTYLCLPSTVKKVGNSAFKNVKIKQLDLSLLDQVLPIDISPIDENKGIIGQSDKKYYPIVTVKNNKLLNQYIADDNWFTYNDYLFKNGPDNITKEIEIKTLNYGHIYSTIDDINNFSTNKNYFEIKGQKIPRNEIVSISFSGFRDVYRLNELFLSNCPNLKSVDLSGATSLTEIGDFFLSGNYWLSEVILPNSITKIGNSFLRECRSLTNFSLETNHISKIGDMFMAGCKSLKSVDISSIKTFIPYKNGMLGWNENLKAIIVANNNLYNKYIVDNNWKSLAHLFKIK